MEKKTDRLRTRDKLAKIERYIMYGYSPYDAELLAEGELQIEEENVREKENGDKRT